MIYTICCYPIAERITNSFPNEFIPERHFSVVLNFNGKQDIITILIIEIREKTKVHFFFHARVCLKNAEFLPISGTSDTNVNSMKVLFDLHTQTSAKALPQHYFQCCYIDAAPVSKVIRELGIPNIICEQCGYIHC